MPAESVRSGTGSRVVVIAGPAAWEALEPLLDAYQVRGFEVCPVTASRPPPMEELQRLAETAEAMLIVGPRNRAPRTVLPGPVLYRKDGSAVPVGWLPNIGGDALQRFALTAAHVHLRQNGCQPLAVLGQWQPQYLRLARRMEVLLKNQGKPVFRWTSDLTFREDMALGLRCGLAAAIYIGHGRPIGWVGYRGLRIHHFESATGEPLGALISLCCRTASRRRTGLSFAEAIPLNGVAAAAFGAVADTLHSNNTRWAVHLCQGLGSGARHMGELVIRSLPQIPQAVADYRILGDPLAPLSGSVGALEAANRVPVYP